MFADKFKTTVEYQHRGKSRVTATYGGRAIPLAYLQGRIAERATGFALLRQDLVDARDWAVRAEEAMTIARAEMGQRRNKNGPTVQKQIHASSELARALFVAAITFYGKAFNTAAGRRLAGLKDKDLEPRFRAAHTFYVTLRDAFAAHSGEERFEQGYAVALIHPNPKKVRSLVVHYEMLRPNLVFEADDGTTIVELIDYTIRIASERLDSARKKIHEIIEKKSIEWWAERVRAGKGIDLDLIAAE